MVEFIKVFLSTIADTFIQIFRWHTTSTPFIGNRLQQRKFEKFIRQDLPGFRDTYADKSETGGVWCVASELILPFTPSHFDHMSSGRDTLLTIALKQSVGAKEIWRSLSSNAIGYDVSSILKKHKNFAFAQLHCNNETHVAFQVFGATEFISSIEERLIDIEVERKSRNEVVNFINSSDY